MKKIILGLFLLIAGSQTASAGEKATFGYTQQRILSGEDILNFMIRFFPYSDADSDACHELTKNGEFSPINGRPIELQPSAVFLSQISRCTSGHIEMNQDSEFRKKTGLSVTKNSPLEEKKKAIAILRDSLIGPGVVPTPEAYDMKILGATERQLKNKSATTSFGDQALIEILKTREFLVY